MKTAHPLAKLVFAVAAYLPLAASAGTSRNTVPEPGTWALVVLAGVIGAVVSRNKRK